MNKLVSECVCVCVSELSPGCTRCRTLTGGGWTSEWVSEGVVQWRSGAVHEQIVSSTVRWFLYSAQCCLITPSLTHSLASLSCNPVMHYNILNQLYVELPAYFYTYLTIVVVFGRQNNRVFMMHLCILEDWQQLFCAKRPHWQGFSVPSLHDRRN